MHSKKVLVGNLYRYFHSRNELTHGFRLRSDFQLAVQEMFAQTADLQDLYMRFVDLDVIEKMHTPLVLMDIGWEQMRKLRLALPMA